MQQIIIDLIPGKTFPICYSSLNDDGRSIRINLVENESAYVLDGSETFSVSVRRPDNEVITIPVENSGSGKSYVDFIVSNDATSISGRCVCNLSMVKDSNTTGVSNFIMEVEEI